ncbi:eukaryotic translation initiation factor 3 subunit A [Senna tora]|uniref:Eukaryotic translation initiation factor 3 subunit A n=1 Tax=Senna tora TaxID=362788 RepID=A0A834VZD0_9FABA|nr:eukaryotic translation initiation factor 3 subunit A [Senna tora]
MIHPLDRKQSKFGALRPSLTELWPRNTRGFLLENQLLRRGKKNKKDMEREEESKRLRLEKITEEAEQRRLATEYEQRKNERILREMKKPKFCFRRMKSEKMTRQTLMELTLTEQLGERQEMEKKLQKLAKTMVYLERAKREEAAPLIEVAYQKRPVEERILHEREQKMSMRIGSSTNGEPKDENLVRPMGFREIHKGIEVINTLGSKEYTHPVSLLAPVQRNVGQSAHYAILRKEIACYFHSRYKSRTYKKNDNVKVGDVVVKNQDFIEATQESNIFILCQPSLMGQLALDFSKSQLRKQCQYNMVEQDVVDEKVFSFWHNADPEALNLV